MSHSDYVKEQRKRLAAVAARILSGEIDAIAGAREISRLAPECEIPRDDPDVSAFIVVASETEALPVGNEREQWRTAALAARQSEVREAVQWAQSATREACENLVSRYARS